MNNAALDGIRQIADAMGCNGAWQWSGPHMSQQMYGITRERAESYAKRYGGTAKPQSSSPSETSNESVKKALRLTSDVVDSSEKEGWIVINAGIKLVHSPRPQGSHDLMKLRIELESLG